jgi:hypothetical protein
LTLGAPAALRLTAPFFLRRYFALRNIGLVPSNVLLLNLTLRTHCGALCKISKTINFRGMLLPPKEP